jgi:hypothetical protein
MEIKIPKAEIFNEVEKRSSIEGYIIPERYDNVWAEGETGRVKRIYLNGEDKVPVELTDGGNILFSQIYKAP